MPTMQAITVQAQTLRDAIKICSRYAKNDCVQLEFSDDLVTVSATNHEQVILSKVRISCNISAKITVKSKTIVGVLSTLSTAELSVNYKESDGLIDNENVISLQIESDGDSIEIPAEENYMPIVVVPESFEPTDADFVNSLKRAIKVTDQDAGRYALSCVCIEDGNIVSTDGKRLYRSDCIKLESAEQLLIPVECCKFAVSEFVSAGVAVANHIFWVNEGEVTMGSRMLEGRFPNWKMVIPSPDKADGLIEFKSTDLITALVKLAPLTDKDYRSVDIDIKDGTCTLNVKTTIGKGRVSFKQDGEFSATLDLQYLRDMLDLHKEDTIRMKHSTLEGERNPVLLDLGFDYVVMPLVRS